MKNEVYSYKVSWMFTPSKQTNSMRVKASSPKEAIEIARQTIIRNMPTSSYGVYQAGKVVEISTLSGVAKHSFSSFKAVAL